jgi:acetyl-CoA carboxylase biotin carboxylase subunit
MPAIRRVLIANRGEIAMRVLRACKAEGLEAVTVYSDADAKAQWVVKAERSVRLGPAPVAQSYLNADAVLAAAKEAGCDALHPGYGLFSENAPFAARATAEGLTWIGPRPETIEAMGVKPNARRRMTQAGVDVVPGSDGPIRSLDEGKAFARAAGYPVMVKAASGGGGIGMERAGDEAALERAVKGVSERAKRYFGSDAVYLEKALDAPRHVEVQVFGDSLGNVVHLFERECSIQRRNQKVVEEAPAPLGDPALAARVAEAAVRAARAVNYVGAGTVEFMVDGQGNPYFLEMNCRIQVEHPVTECITGIDLVREQLRVAAGNRLTFRQEDVARSGWALQLRLYAEDPSRGFVPSPGPLDEFEIPAAPGVRVDTGFAAGDVITPHYDPLIAKLVFHAEDRAAVIRKALDTLGRSRVGPLRTNLDLHRRVLESRAFQEGRLSTDFLQRLQSTP